MAEKIHRKDVTKLVFYPRLEVNFDGVTVTAGEHVEVTDPQHLGLLGGDYKARDYYIIEMHRGNRREIFANQGHGTDWVPCETLEAAKEHCDYDKSVKAYEPIYFSEEALAKRKYVPTAEGVMGLIGQMPEDQVEAFRKRLGIGTPPTAEGVMAMVGQLSKSAKDRLVKSLTAEG